MQLPPELRAGVEREAETIAPAVLASAAERLSQAYRQGLGRKNISVTESIAYSLVRLPATYAAVASVLREIAPSRTLLDLGAGPGTAGWAAAECWPELQSITSVEREPALLSLGKNLASQARAGAVRGGQWIAGDLTATSFEPHDTVILSYSLGERAEPFRWRIVEAAWSAARQALILIEPGTTAGFAVIDAARDRLIEIGGQIAAPCPHAQPCPIRAGDWCHFAARVERTALHRRLKGAAMGYEDEKFSYVAACRGEVEPARARIIRRPVKDAGLIQLSLCAGEGLAQKQIRKRDGDLWRAARKSAWGGRWDH
jgi:ribosomal protein RSM22 (predicted rRNA methylase)